MKAKSKIVSLLFLAIAGILLMSVLFRLSEKKERFNNSFIRRFPPHMAMLSKTRSLKFNSYYFAGCGNGNVYLGNSTAPFLVTVLDSALNTVSVSNITLDRIPKTGLPQLRVNPPYFYFYDGAMPYVYSGKIGNWHAKFITDQGNAFSQLQAIGANSFVARYNEAPEGKNSIRISEVDSLGVKYIGHDLLAETNRDVFESDGYLVFDRQSSTAAYVCYYKNTFLVGKSEMSGRSAGRTIDTVTSQQINIANVKSRKEKTFSKMPLLVNRLAAADNGWLYVNSQVIGKHEPLEMWKESSIVDIYDLESKGYIGSLYIADIERKKIRSMIVDGNSLYALSGMTIVKYSIDKTLVKH